MRRDWAEVIIFLRTGIRKRMKKGHLVFKDPPCLVYGLDIEYIVREDPRCAYSYFLNDSLMDKLKNREAADLFVRHYISNVTDWLKKRGLKPEEYLEL